MNTNACHLLIISAVFDNTLSSMFITYSINDIINQLCITNGVNKFHLQDICNNTCFQNYKRGHALLTSEQNRMAAFYTMKYKLKIHNYNC